MASAQSSETLAGALEILSVLRAEVSMFLIAGVVYLALWFGWVARPKAILKSHKANRSPSPSAQKPVQHKVQRDVSSGPKIRAQAVQNRPETAGCWSAHPLPCDAAKFARQIREHGKEGKLDAAVAAFDKLQERHLKAIHYNSILDACVQCGDMPKAMSYFSAARQARLADVVSYNIILKGHLAACATKKACDLVAEMASEGVSANHATYLTLLQASVQAGDEQGAWACMSRMRASGLQPTSPFCSMLLKFVNTPASKSSLKRVTDLIDASGLATDEAVLPALVEACLKSQQLDLLARRLSEYRRHGIVYQLPPSAYGSMMKAYGQARNIKQVWTLWSEMQRCKVQPSTIAMGCMVDALVMNGLEQDAWDLVQGLWQDESHRELLNTVIYSTIVKGFAMSRRLDKALAVYEEMRARNMPCNTITYNTILNALVRCGDLRRLPQLLDDMQTSSPKVEPDMITYSTIMKGYCSAGDLDKGLALLMEMESDGQFTPDEVMFNSLLDGCAKERRLDDALALLDKMRAAGVPPSNYTLSIMVKLLGRSKRLGKAFTMVQDIASEFGFRPNIQVYTCLIQACFHNKDIAKALALHDQVVAEGCHFDSKAYVSLVRGCLQAGALDKAAEVVRCAFGLPGSSLRRAQGQAPGLDKQCVDEVLSRLRRSGTGNAKLAQQLASDLSAKDKGHDLNGVAVKSSTPAKAVSASWRRPVVPDHSDTCSTDCDSSANSSKNLSDESSSDDGETSTL